MTDSNTPPTSENKDISVDNSSSDKVVSKKSAPKKIASTKTLPIAVANKISKLAIFALLVAIMAPAGHYYWQQLQNQQIAKTLTNKVSEQNSATLSRYQTEMQQALAKQQQSFDQQLQQIISEVSKSNQNKILALDATVAQLEQNIQQRQPSDWLLHEAEYLIRIAARSLWLERDTSAAIGLLKDADTRLTELNDPAFLPVREVIHQDIKSLELMPKLKTDEIVLALMAMNKQVAILPLALQDLDKEDNKDTDFELSNDINDWQTNLAKTWQKFLNDFIRVRQRVGSVEALISPKQQAHLKQNLSLKIQLALWAASERKSDIYQKSLTDVHQWLNDYFDMEHNYNQRFIKALVTLQEHKVNYSYPSELGSLKAIRLTFRSQQLKTLLAPKKTTEDVKADVQDTSGNEGEI